MDKTAVTAPSTALEVSSNTATVATIAKTSGKSFISSSSLAVKIAAVANGTFLLFKATAFYFAYEFTASLILDIIGLTAVVTALTYVYLKGPVLQFSKTLPFVTIKEMIGNELDKEIQEPTKLAPLNSLPAETFEKMTAEIAKELSSRSTTIATLEPLKKEIETKTTESKETTVAVTEETPKDAPKTTVTTETMATTVSVTEETPHEAQKAVAITETKETSVAVTEENTKDETKAAEKIETKESDVVVNEEATKEADKETVTKETKETVIVKEVSTEESKPTPTSAPLTTASGEELKSVVKSMYPADFTEPTTEPKAEESKEAIKTTAVTSFKPKHEKGILTAVGTPQALQPSIVDIVELPPKKESKGVAQTVKSLFYTGTPKSQPTDQNAALFSPSNKPELGTLMRKASDAIIYVKTTKKGKYDIEHGVGPAISIGEHEITRFTFDENGKRNGLAETVNTKNNRVVYFEYVNDNDSVEGKKLYEIKLRTNPKEGDRKAFEDKVEKTLVDAGHTMSAEAKELLKKCNNFKTDIYELKKGVPVRKQVSEFFLDGTEKTHK